MRDRNLQIEDGVFVFLAGTDSDLFELDDRSDLRFGVLVLGGRVSSSSRCSGSLLAMDELGEETRSDAKWKRRAKEKRPG